MVLHEVSLLEILTNGLDPTPDTLLVMAELAWAVKRCHHGIIISVVSVTHPFYFVGTRAIGNIVVILLKHVGCIRSQCVYCFLLHIFVQRVFI